jgi:hypothetical protein
VADRLSSTVWRPEMGERTRNLFRVLVNMLIDLSGECSVV